MFRTLMVAVVLTFPLAGCAAYQTGQEPISRAQVESIQKGATTRAQIEAMFGPPISIAIVDNGDRLASYRAHQTTVPPVNGATFIPLVGPFIAASQDPGTSVRRQTLQVRYSASGVVQDYEFLDTTTLYSSDGTILRSNTEPAPAAMPTSRS
ncbi:MAG: hypothetical protein JOY64_26080 [Alphaproteobacteria bacterium]|nr:hypothetical protein [Alphaproteobacteria bacterium]